MKHLKAITLKYILASAVFYLFGGLLYQLSLDLVFWPALALTLIGYLLDLLLLPANSNKRAAWIDFPFYLLTVWILITAASTDEFPIAGPLLTAACLAFSDKIVLHAYVRKYVIRNGKDKFYNVIFMDKFRTNLAGGLPAKSPRDK